MSGEKTRKNYATKVLKTLRKHWPEVSCTLDHVDPFQLLVATILSAQCTDARVNKVTPELFRRFDSVQKFADASLESIEEAIHSTGFYHAKAKNIRDTARTLLERFDGNVPEDLPSLLTLPGVGRKTANVVLGNAFGIVSGVVVDTHVSRLSQRLGLSKAKTPEKIELDLMALFPKSAWVDVSHLMIHLGREFCQARGPRCETCPMKSLCPRIGIASVTKKTPAKKTRP